MISEGPTTAASAPRRSRAGLGNGQIRSAIQTSTFVFMFPGAPGARFQYNLDFAADGAGLIWRAAGAPLTFKGLAPGNHQISVRAVGAGGLTGDPAYYSWYGSGPVALLDSAVVSDYPAWRHYCSINSGPEFICRPAGLTLKGLPKGRVAVQIRALAGPGDLAPDQGRRTIIAWDTVGVAPIDPFTLSDSLWGV